MTDHLKSFLSGVSERAAAATGVDDTLLRNAAMERRLVALWATEGRKSPHNLRQAGALENGAALLKAIPKLLAIIEAQAETINELKRTDLGWAMRHGVEREEFTAQRRAELERLCE